MSFKLDINQSIVEQAADIEDEVQQAEFEYLSSFDEEALSWGDIYDITSELDGYAEAFGIYASYYATIVEMSYKFSTLVDETEAKAVLDDVAEDLAALFKEWREYYYYSELHLREHMDRIQQELETVVSLYLT